MPQLKTHRQVDSDIHEAALWYEERCAGLGGKFIDAVRNATGLIAENPLRNAVRFDHVRRLNLQRFPYSTWYFVSNEAAYARAFFTTNAIIAACWINAANRCNAAACTLQFETADGELEVEWAFLWSFVPA